MNICGRSFANHFAQPFGKISTLLYLGMMTSVMGADLQLLPGHVPQAVQGLTAMGRFGGTNRLHLAISLPPRNTNEMTSLLADLYNPASTNFHHFLTPAQFTAQFGPTEADAQAVAAFARSNGFTTTIHPNRLLVDLEGSVTAIESAFHTTLRVYRHPVETNRTFYAPDTEPSMNLPVKIMHISGLDNYAPPQPVLKKTALINSRNFTANAGSGPSGNYMGADFRDAYVPDTTLTGASQKVGLLQFDGYTTSDITYYESLNGLPNLTLTNVLLDGFSGFPTGSGGEVEVSLDIEMSMSMAPGLAEIIVYEAGPNGNWHDILNRMATDNLARQLSCSWYVPGGAADPVADVIFQQMAMQGQSFYAASGDSDAYTGLIPFPGDTPYITEVGGTTLTTTGGHGSWVSETVWNWGDGQGSGGGISTQYPIPYWQTNLSMAGNQGSTTMRNSPDVALTADNVFVEADGQPYSVGGTSCAAPLWAGFTALVNQQAAATANPPVGFINPALDVISQSPTYTNCFHDITTGNNTSPYSPGKFYAATGYDLCTGWGAPAGQALINALANPEPFQIAPTVGFTALGGVGGPFTVTAETLTLTNAGTNALSWSLTPSASWLNLSKSSGTLTPGGGATVLTVSLNSAAGNLTTGSYTNHLWFTNLTDHAGQDRPFTLLVLAPPVITAQPSNEVILEGANASFHVAASGQYLTYQWQFDGTNLVDGGNLSGSTTPTLSIANAVLNEAGAYDVIVSNVAGMVVSSNVVLAIPPSPPVITEQPTSQTVYAGRRVQLSTAALGNEPITYQWNFDGTNISQATNATLLLTNVQLTQSGNYSAQVANEYGATNSAIAVLTVNPPPPCDPPPAGLVNWWAAESNALDSAGTNNGTLVGGVTYAPGEVGEAFSLDGSSGYVTIPDAPSLEFTTNLTIELWLKANLAEANSDWRGIVTKGNNTWRLQATSGSTTVTFSTTGVNSTNANGDLFGSRSVNDGQWHHVAAVYDGTNKYIYIDGVVDASTPATGAILRDNSPVDIGMNSGAPNNSYYFNGLLDEVSLYNRALSANEIQNIYIIGVGGKCPQPPTIAVQPASQSVLPGQTAVFGVAAVGAPFLTYQWMFQSNAISGATNSTLVISNSLPVNDGIYSVTVENAYGSIGSSNAQLMVLTYPPTITQQPQSETVYAGSSAAFTVMASGTAPLAYQWIFNGTNLVGSTNETLVLPNVQVSQSGNYSALVTNPYGSATSGVAVLTVNPQATCYPAPAGLVNWWAAEGNASDTVGTNNGTLVGNVGFVAGEVGQAFSFNGSSSYVTIPDAPPLDDFRTNLTIEVWIKPGITGLNPNWAGIVTKGNNSWRLQATANANTVTFSTTGVSSTNANGDLFGSRNVNDGQWHHVAAVYDGINKYIYVDGALDISTPATGEISQNNYPVDIGQNAGAQGYYFNGLIDEASLYNKALTASQVQDIYLAGGGGKCQPPPTILTQPTNLTVTAGNTAAFSITAVGAQPLSFQWYYQSNLITGATNSNLLLTNVQTFNDGYYSVSVENSHGFAASSNALLTVLAVPPTILAQPTNLTVNADSTALFTVTASGTPPISYQWYYEGTYAIAGATDSTLGLTNTQTYNDGTYSVVVSNHFGTITSSNALLTVIAYPPVIVTQPANITVNAGGNAAFTVAASGTAPLYYQWFFNLTNLLSGATGASLSLSNVEPAQGGNYSAVVTNFYGTVTTTNARLTVITFPPAIVTQPTNETVYTGGTVGFTVTASGTSPLKYQWSFNNSVINGATNPALILTNAQPAQAGTYFVSVLNPYGLAHSANATLEVIPPSSCVAPPSSLVNWWKAEGNANDSLGTNNGSTVGSVAYAAGEVGQAFSLNGSGSYVSIPNAAPLNFTRQMTVEVWVKGNSLAANPDWRAIVAKGNYSWRLQGVSGEKTVDFSTTGLGNADLIGTRNINDGQWHHVAGVYDGTNKYLYVDGTLDVSVATSGSIAQTTASLGIGENSESINGYYFNGLIDEVSLYNRGLSSNEIYAIYAAGSGGKCPPLPVITAQPQSQLTMPGCSIAFTVGATGVSPLGYQWYQNGSPLNAQTNSSLVINNVQSTNFGNYWVVITTSAGAAITSSTAVLGLDHAPVAGLSTIQRFITGGVKVPISMLLSNATDADGDLPSITAVSANSAANGSLVLSNNWIYYTPPVGYNNSDIFTYTLSDGHCGGTSVGYVTVQVQTNTAVPGTLGIQSGAAGSTVLNFSGVPGLSYRIQTTTSLWNPNWTNLSTNIADFFGGIQVTNPVSLSAAAQYYRAVTP